MAIVTSIGVVALASMAAILINDHTRLGGRLDDGDDDFSLFTRPVSTVTVPVTAATAAIEAGSKSKEAALI